MAVGAPLCSPGCSCLFLAHELRGNSRQFRTFSGAFAFGTARAGAPPPALPERSSKNFMHRGSWYLGELLGWNV